MGDDERSSDTSYPARREERFPEEYAGPDDEISLYDLWNALASRWYVIAGVLVVTVSIAMLYALTREPAYQYRTGVEIGTVGSGETDDVLVESPAETRNRLQEAIIPSVRAELAGEQDTVPGISLAGGEESSLIVLSTESVEEHRDAIRQVHGNVTQRLEDTHQRVIATRRDRLELRQQNLEDDLEYLQDDRVLASQRESHEQAIAAAESEIASLQEQREEKRTELQTQISNQERRLKALADERELTEAELDRVDERVEIVKRRIESTETLLTELREHRMELTRNTDDDPTLALFLGTTELDHVQQRLDNLEDELNFGLPAQREQLRAQLQDNRRTQGEVEDALAERRIELENLEGRFDRRVAAQQRTIQEHETALAVLEADNQQKRRDKERQIAEVETRMADIVPTDTTFLSVRSVEPAGAGNALILALSVVLGGMLGPFAALFAQFVSSARARARQGAGGD